MAEKNGEKQEKNVFKKIKNEINETLKKIKVAKVWFSTNKSNRKFKEIIGKFK